MMEEKVIAEHPYIHLFALCLGLVIQALFPTSYIACIIGYVLIMLSPFKLYTNYLNRIYEDPGDKTQGKWLPFPDDKLEELLSYVKPRASTAKGGSRSFGKVGMRVFIGFVITALMVVSMAGYFTKYNSLDYNCVFLLTLPMLIAVLSCFYGPIVAAHPLGIQVTALTTFKNMPLPASFSKKFEARLVKDINGEPDILEARLQIRPNDPIDPLLCMMATISRTDVQGTIYPYAYYVLVFKSRRLFDVSMRFSSELCDFINNSHFRMENSVKNDESVIVILPKNRRKYTTDANDCRELAQLMYGTCVLLDKYRDEITTILN